MSRYFIVGTDTGVGKTVLSLLLMQYWYKKGVTPFYIKPFQTGCRDPYDTDSDARFIYHYVTQLSGKDPGDAVIYCFTTPKAPYFAGLDQGETVDIHHVLNVVDKKSRLFSPLIIEAAGGLFVPVNNALMVIDIVNQLKAKPILAARAGLGTINHTLLSIEALQTRNMPAPIVIFMDNSESGISDDFLTENMEAVEKFSGVKVAGVIKKIHDFTNPGEAYHDLFDQVFGASDIFKHKENAK